MIYRVSYSTGRPSRCNCCDESYTREEDFYSKKDVIDFLSKIEAAKRLKRPFDNLQYAEVHSVKEVLEDDLYYTLEYDEKLVNRLMKKEPGE